MCNIYLRFFCGKIITDIVIKNKRHSRMLLYLKATGTFSIYFITTWKESQEVIILDPSVH